MNSKSLILYLSICSLFYCDVIAQIPTDGFVASYPFNGNANDESGNGHNGVVIGATLVNDRFGNPNSAYRFDGTDDNILVYNFPMPASELTISLWARSEVEKKHMVFKQLPDGINRVAASINYYTTWTTMEYPDSINTYWDFGNTSQGRIYACLNEAHLNEWEHYIFQVSNKNTFMKVFLNGELAIYDNTAVTLQDSTFTLAIGGSEYIDIGLFYQGDVDDINIYNRILDSTEISLLYNEMKPPVTDGLVAYYPFNGNANDETGNGHDGIVHGATLTTDRCNIENSAYLFDGYTNYIELPYSTVINTDNSFSIVAWINNYSITADSKYNDNAIFGQTDGEVGTDYPIIAFEVKVDNTLRTLVRGSDNPTVDFRTTESIQNYTWNQVSLVRDAQNDSLGIYINGELARKVGTYLVGNTSTCDWISLGAYYDDLESIFHYLHGKIDDVMIFDKALTDDEIKELYSIDCYETLLTGESIVCQGDENIVYSLISSVGLTNYTWTYSGTGVTINGNSDIVYLNFSEDATSGSLSVTVSGNAIPAQTKQLPITVNYLPDDAGMIDGEQLVCMNQSLNYTVLAIGSATSYSWEYGGTGVTINDNSNSVFLDFANEATSGNLTVTGTNNCGSGGKSPELFISVNSCSEIPDGINIPNAFSPNGDGINDYFVIDGIPEYSHLIIFSREGRKLFESESYANEWNGIDQDGNILETGTYWYVLKLNGIQSDLKGFVYLKK